MKNLSLIFSALFALALLTISCKRNEEEKNVTIINATGDINTALNKIRNLIGGNLNTTTGVTGGRREINWDSVPADMLGKKLPTDFFNTVGNNVPHTRQRGIGYTDEGAFMVSSQKFAEVNTAVANEFIAFSGANTFANVGAMLWDMVFEVPGQKVAANINAFGAVFSDVDVANTTYIEYFENNKSLGKFYVPKQNGSKFSFLGVHFKNNKVTRVRVGHDGKLNDKEHDVSQGGNHDLIVLDDFIYSEPVAK
jgi:hypothetical protein